MPTFSPTPKDINPEWKIIDAEGLVLGRVATQAATLLRGKHKPTFAPHMDMGDFVIIINADKVVLTGTKAERKWKWHHSGFPGGIKGKPMGQILAENPEKLVYDAVKGMIPHNKLGAVQIRKLKVYAGSEHPHAAQNPTPVV